MDMEGTGHGIIRDTTYLNIYLNGPRKTRKIPGQDSWSSGQDLKLGHPECKAGKLNCDICYGEYRITKYQCRDWDFYFLVLYLAQNIICNISG
jgi:hypothetical protein